MINAQQILYAPIGVGNELLPKLTQLVLKRTFTTIETVTEFAAVSLLLRLNVNTP